MNSWLDRGFFLLVLYTLTYIAFQGQKPDWIALYAGAGMMIVVGIIIELAKAGKLK